MTKSFVTTEASDTESTKSDSTGSVSPMLTVHRRQLQRIATDGARNSMHRVPDRLMSIRASQKTKRVIRRYKEELLHNRTRDDWIATFLPAYKWLKTYNWRTTFSKDVIAGLTVGAMIVPQSMSYAELAGLPVEYGLYSALVPVYIYSLFGSSRQLAVGPVALISLLVSTGIADVLANVLPRDSWEGTGEEYDVEYERLSVNTAIQLGFLTGVMYIGMGLLRLGFVTIFLSHAVVSGFTTGAAVIIGMSQVKYIFGCDVKGSKLLHEMLHNIFANTEQFKWRTFLMGMCSILALITLKHIGKHYPRYKWVRAAGPLTVTGITILVTWAANLSDKGIEIVEDIPRGLPSYSAHVWTDIQNVGKVMQVTIGIVIVGFMESIAIAKQLASKHKYDLDSSLELLGLGMANFFGAMFQSYPVTGSFSRSAVNNDSGAQSGISGIVTATLVAIVLLCLTPVFEQMPYAVLGAIVISGVLGLLDYEEAIFLYRTCKFDFFVWMVAFLGTMFLGVEIGLAIAVAVSLLLVLYESAYPHTAQLGRLPGTTVYRNVKQYPEAERYEGLVLVRIDAPIYFANTQNIREKLQKYELAAEQELAQHSGASVKFIILELSPVSHVDSSGLHILKDMVQNYQDRGIQLCFCNPSAAVMDRFLACGLADEVGRQHIFVAIQDAVSWCLQEMCP